MLSEITPWVLADVLGGTEAVAGSVVETPARRGMPPESPTFFDAAVVVRPATEPEGSVGGQWLSHLQWVPKEVVAAPEQLISKREADRELNAAGESESVHQSADVGFASEEAKVGQTPSVRNVG